MDVNTKLNKNEILIISLTFIFSFGIIMTIFDFDLTLNSKISQFQNEKEDIFFSRTSNVEKNKLFSVMSNVQNYTQVLPTNIISIDILNQTENEIYAYEEVMELGIKSKLLVKHTIIPYQTHTIEILDGDAKGTKLKINFVNKDNSTEINSQLSLKVKGILTPFRFLPDSSLHSALNTVFSAFEEYTKNES